MLLFEINFGDRYPPYRTAVSLSSIQGVLAESSFRKQAWKIQVSTAFVLIITQPLHIPDYNIQKFYVQRCLQLN